MILNYPIISIAGVYVLTNTTNGKKYYGETDNFRRRIRRHGTDFIKGKANKLMQLDYDAGHDFTFDVVKIMEDSTRKSRMAIERSLTASNEDGYNVYEGKSGIGEINSRATITEDQAIQIINLLKSGMSMRKVSEELQVSFKIVENIKYNLAWCHLPR